MTISTPVDKVRADGNGTARNFSFSPMTIYGADDLQVITRVIATGVETPISRGSSSTTYQLNLTTFPGTGSIDYPASGGTLLPSTEEIVIKRVLTLEQQLKLTRAAYDPATTELQFDKVVAMIIQMQEELDRSLKVPVGDLDTVSTLLAEANVNATKFIRVLATGLGFEYAELSSTTSVLSDGTPSRTTIAGGASGSSDDISRRDHTHQIPASVITATNMFNASNFI